MWKTARKGETKHLISLNAQTWWGVIKRIMEAKPKTAIKCKKALHGSICKLMWEISVWLPDYSVVRGISTQEVLENTKRLPFTSRPAWFSVQNECPDLRRVNVHLYK